MTRGKFITFEGGEGAGKSTQAKRLAERVRSLGHDVILTREPGGTPFAERLRRLLLDPEAGPHSSLAETLVFYAARADHLDRIIRPALSTGTWVICDRFSDSTRVYQGHASRVPFEVLHNLEAMVVKNSVPDLTIIIDLDPALGLERAQQRRGPQASAQGVDIFERRDLAFHGLLREGFLAIAHAEPQRCAIVNGANSVDVVAQDIARIAESRLFAKAG